MSSNNEPNSSQKKRDNYMDEIDLKKNGFYSILFLKKAFLVKKADQKKVSGYCSSNTEFSEGTGNSTLKKHLKAKHPIQYNELFSNKEESELPRTQSDTSEENFGSNIKTPFSIKKMAKITDGQFTIEEAFETKNAESVVKNFALLKAIHGLPYRIFDSIYFKNALDSFRNSGNRIEKSSYAISKELENTHILS